MSSDVDAVQIKLEGFQATNAEEQELMTELKEMMELCPYNSAANCYIRKLTNAYNVEIQVKHSLGQFRAFGEDLNLAAALETAVKSIFQSLEFWRRERFQEVSSDSPRGDRKLKVLLVDDDPMSVKLLDSCLRQQGCRTTVASDGAQALVDFSRDKFDLVIMDWNMPQLSGKETLVAMDRSLNDRSEENLSKIPVLIYSISDKDKVHFPRTRRMRQMGHLRKATPMRILRGATKGFIGQLAKGVEG